MKKPTVEELKKEVAALYLMKAMCEKTAVTQLEIVQMNKLYKRRLNRVKTLLEAA